MSVIIRLQGLSWSASAMDIRNFFKGLSIPPGGVRIIGGEKGDAFIAFGTDEDARQAMMMSSKLLNDLPVQLYLSSKTEMQNTILQAKTTTTTPPVVETLTPAAQQPTLQMTGPSSGLLANQQTSGGATGVKIDQSTLASLSQISGLLPGNIQQALGFLASANLTNPLGTNNAQGHTTGVQNNQTKGFQSVLPGEYSVGGQTNNVGQYRPNQQANFNNSNIVNQSGSNQGLGQYPQNQPGWGQQQPFNPQGNQSPQNTVHEPPSGFPGQRLPPMGKLSEQVHKQPQQPQTSVNQFGNTGMPYGRGQPAVTKQNAGPVSSFGKFFPTGQTPPATSVARTGAPGGNLSSRGSSTSLSDQVDEFGRNKPVDKVKSTDTRDNKRGSKERDRSRDRSRERSRRDSPRDRDRRDRDSSRRRDRDDDKKSRRDRDRDRRPRDRDKDRDSDSSSSRRGTRKRSLSPDSKDIKEQDKKLQTNKPGSNVPSALETASKPFTFDTSSLTSKMTVTSQTAIPSATPPSVSSVSSPLFPVVPPATQAGKNILGQPPAFLRPLLGLATSTSTPTSGLNPPNIPSQVPPISQHMSAGPGAQFPGNQRYPGPRSMLPQGDVGARPNTRMPLMGMGPQGAQEPNRFRPPNPAQNSYGPVPPVSGMNRMPAPGNRETNTLLPNPPLVNQPFIPNQKDQNTNAPYGRGQPPLDGGFRSPVGREQGNMGPRDNFNRPSEGPGFDHPPDQQPPFGGRGHQQFGEGPPVGQRPPAFRGRGDGGPRFGGRSAPLLPNPDQPPFETAHDHRGPPPDHRGAPPGAFRDRQMPIDDRPFDERRHHFHGAPDREGKFENRSPPPFDDLHGVPPGPPFDREANIQGRDNFRYQSHRGRGRGGHYIDNRRPPDFPEPPVEDHGFGPPEVFYDDPLAIRDRGRLEPGDRFNRPPNDVPSDFRPPFSNDRFDGRPDDRLDGEPGFNSGPGERFAGRGRALLDTPRGRGGDFPFEGPQGRGDGRRFDGPPGRFDGPRGLEFDGPLGRVDNMCFAGPPGRGDDGRFDRPLGPFDGPPGRVGRGDDRHFDGPPGREFDSGPGRGDDMCFEGPPGRGDDRRFHGPPGLMDGPLGRDDIRFDGPPGRNDDRRLDGRSGPGDDRRIDGLRVRDERRSGAPTANEDDRRFDGPRVRDERHPGGPPSQGNRRMGGPTGSTFNCPPGSEGFVDKRFDGPLGQREDRRLSESEDWDNRVPPTGFVAREPDRNIGGAPGRNDGRRFIGSANDIRQGDFKERFDDVPHREDRRGDGPGPQRDDRQGVERRSERSDSRRGDDKRSERHSDRDRRSGRSDDRRVEDKKADRKRSEDSSRSDRRSERDRRDRSDRSDRGRETRDKKEESKDKNRDDKNSSKVSTREETKKLEDKSIDSPKKNANGESTAAIKDKENADIRKPSNIDSSTKKELVKVSEMEKMSTDVEKSLKTVLISNLAKDATYKEIRKFFSNCDIPKNGIKLINDGEGKRTDKTFILFSDEISFKEALKKDRLRLKALPIVIKPVPRTEYDAAIDSYTPPGSLDRGKEVDLCNTMSATLRALKGEPELTLPKISSPRHQEDFVVKIEALPNNTTSDAIRRLFHGCAIAKKGEAIFIDSDSKLPCTGVSYVEFENDESFKKAMQRKWLNGISIKLTRSNKQAIASMLAKMKAEVEANRAPEKKDPKPSVQSVRPADTKSPDIFGSTISTPEIKLDSDQVFLRLKNTLGLKNWDIRPIFDGLGVKVINVQVAHDAIGKPVGEAFVEFDNSASAQKALQKKNNLYVKGQKISMEPLNRVEAIESLRMSKQALQPEPPSRDDVFYFVKASGLPKNATTGELMIFFTGYQPAPESIRLNIADGNQPPDTSTALIGFRVREDAERAVGEKNQQLLRAQKVQLTKCATVR
ncbi:uncharacterized protein LOC128243137 isoform X1 [Mya arenaria]|uniref:uncharacterized protein LOC128243137 isoform X1 n=1 Tax=Mya arenaria TaxID=6604 RepID=UPI0022E05A86|nr:uncharacterized protein LOC128243137 isoform X1 [Mya arenaria]XP_052816659.1 uncharacterized protein LOC128243137 isoform X1 [Mya arenaria]